MKSGRLMCPHCGWRYSPPFNAGVPHQCTVRVPWHPEEVDGGYPNYVECPGARSVPRNPDTDLRPLGNGKDPAEAWRVRQEWHDRVTREAVERNRQAAGSG